jgi:hypothetical protein
LDWVGIEVPHVQHIGRRFFLSISKLSDKNRERKSETKKVGGALNHDIAFDTLTFIDE